MSRLNLFAALLLGVSLTALGCQQAATPEARTADKPVVEAEGEKPMTDDAKPVDDAKPAIDDQEKTQADASEAAPDDDAAAPAENEEK